MMSFWTQTTVFMGQTRKSHDSKVLPQQYAQGWLRHSRSCLALPEGSGHTLPTQAPPSPAPQSSVTRPLHRSADLKQNQSASAAPRPSCTLEPPWSYNTHQHRLLSQRP